MVRKNVLPKLLLCTHIQKAEPKWGCRSVRSAIIAGSCVLGLIAPRVAQAEVYRFQRDGFEIRVAIEAAGFEGPYPLSRAVVSASTGSDQTVGTEFGLDGDLEAAWVTDLDGNGRPEVLLWVRPLGSGGYGELKFMDIGAAGVAVRSLPALASQQEGYRGHDHFTVTSTSLVRSFPVYRNQDANCCPSGGTAEVTYSYNGDAITLTNVTIR